MTPRRTARRGVRRRPDAHVARRAPRRQAPLARLKRAQPLPLTPGKPLPAAGLGSTLCGDDDALRFPSPAAPRPQPIDPSLDLEDEIARLKKEKNAVILGALLPGQRDPGPRRLHRRLASARAGRGEDEGRRHLLRRRALHGRDGEDPEPRPDRRDPRPRSGLLARVRRAGREDRRVEARAIPARSSSATSTARPR